MKFCAELNGKKTKVFSAKNKESIYTQYNKYCKQKLNNPSYVLDSSADGGLFWSDGTNNIKLVRIN
jgi:hypothetical protein